ncbi:MAG: DUF11 domain-containing protein [Caldilineaceae bacterium]|nr:DUF11 domain-containing protein [Caldilineaceae bacterium]
MVVSDTIHSKLSQVQISTTAGVFIVNSWVLPSLAPGNSARLTLSAVVTGSGALTNTAQIIGATDGNGLPLYDPITTTGNIASVGFPNIPAAADLSVVKTTNGTDFQVGDVVQYLVRVTNNGPDTATNVVLTDTLPAGVEYVFHFAPPPTSYITQTGRWSIGTLVKGQTVALTLGGRFGTLAAGKTVTNTTEGLVGDQADWFQANNTGAGCGAGGRRRPGGRQDGQQSQAQCGRSTALYGRRHQQRPDCGLQHRGDRSPLLLADQRHQRAWPGQQLSQRRLDGRRPAGSVCLRHAGDHGCGCARCGGAERSQYGDRGRLQPG